MLLSEVINNTFIIPASQKRQNNYSSSVMPSVNDDILAGYDVGSFWVLVDPINNSRLFYCENATSGAAVWTEVSMIDRLIQSSFSKEVMTICIFDTTENVVVGDLAGNQLIRIPAKLNLAKLISAHAYVYTAGTGPGTLTIQINNITKNVDMLSQFINIENTETDSITAATLPVVNTSNDTVNTGDKIRIDVDSVSSSAPKGLWVELTFQVKE